MKITKGERGYIPYKKKTQTVIVLIFVCAGLSLFFLCLKILGTTKNLGTVAAVLLTLPAAKALVNLILFIPYKTCPDTFAEAVKPCIRDTDSVWYDLVFTSLESAMHLDFLLARGNKLIAYSESPSKDDKIKTYLTDSLGKRGVSVHVGIFHKEADAIRRLETCEREEPVSEELKDFIHMILVR